MTELWVFTPLHFLARNRCSQYFKITHMKNLCISIFLISIFVACGNMKKENNSATSTEESIKTETILPDNSLDFLSLFKDIKPEGLHIYPPRWNKEGKLIETPFEGTKVDVNKFTLLDEKIFFNLKACKEGLSNIYAIGKFEINDKYTGLVTRQHSQYSESLIQLMIWEKQSKTIKNSIELADSFGDEGWYFDKESWIIEFKPNETLKIVTRRKDCNPNDDFTKFSYTDSLKLHQMKELEFTSSDLNINDTVSYQLKEWR